MRHRPREIFGGRMDLFDGKVVGKIRRGSVSKRDRMGDEPADLGRPFGVFLALCVNNVFHSER